MTSRTYKPRRYTRESALFAIEEYATHSEYWEVSVRFGRDLAKLVHYLRKREDGMSHRAAFEHAGRFA